MFRIYLLRNDANEKCYVGVTKKFFGRRICEHVWAARRKDGAPGSLSGDLKIFGEEHFSAHVLEHVEIAAQAAARERYWIAAMNATYPAGYNVGLLDYWMREKVTATDALTREAWNLDQSFREEAVRRIYVYEKNGPYKVSAISETPHQIEYEIACERGLAEAYFGDATVISVSVDDMLQKVLGKKQES